MLEDCFLVFLASLILFLPLVKMLKLGRRCSEGQGMLPFKATKRESSSKALPFYSFLEYMLQVWTEDFI